MLFQRICLSTEHGNKTRLGPSLRVLLNDTRCSPLQAGVTDRRIFPGFVIKAGEEGAGRTVYIWES